MSRMTVVVLALLVASCSGSSDHRPSSGVVPCADQAPGDDRGGGDDRDGDRNCPPQVVPTPTPAPQPSPCQGAPGSLPPPDVPCQKLPVIP